MASIFALTQTQQQLGEDLLLSFTGLCMAGCQNQMLLSR